MNQKAVTTKKTFSRQTAVSVDIAASAEKVWALLTNAPEYTKWNTTIVSLDGEITPGNTIKLVSTLDPKRTFKLKVKVFEPASKLVWGDPMGARTYTLTPNRSGVTLTMSEKIGGPIYPLFASKIPSFDQSFDTFVADIKKEAERN